MSPWLIDITLRMEPPTVTHQAKRLGWRMGKNKATGKARAIPTMGDSPDLKRALGNYARALMTAKGRPVQPLGGFIELEVWFVWEWDNDIQEWRGTFPDWDNAAKTLQDAMCKAGYISNDCRVVRAIINKLNAPEPGIRIRLRELPPFEQCEGIW